MTTTKRSKITPAPSTPTGPGILAGRTGWSTAAGILAASAAFSAHGAAALTDPTALMQLAGGLALVFMKEGQ